MSGWLPINLLCIKAKQNLFCLDPNLAYSQSGLSITCKGTATFKYFGVVLEQYLSGANMATSIIQRANARLKFLHRKGRVSSTTTEKLLVMPLVKCHFDYGCSFWYPGLSNVLKINLRLPKIKSMGLCLTRTQWHMWAQTFKKRD